MEYFELLFDVDHYKWVAPVGAESAKRIAEVNFSPVAREWVPISLHAFQNQKGETQPYADYPPFFGRALLCLSNHGAMCLRPLLGNGEVLETSGLEGRYVLWHCLDVKDALVPQRSNRLPVDARQLKLRSQLLCGNIFVLSTSSTTFIVSNVFKQAVEQHKLTGFLFKTIEVESLL